MVNYANLAATAKRLIEANGRDATLYRRDPTPANAAEPWRGPSTTPADSMGPVKVAFVPASGSGFGRLLYDQLPENAAKIDQVGLLAASSIADLDPAPTQTDPAEYHSVVDGSVAFRIVEVGTLKPGDTVLVYFLGLVS